MKKTLIFGAIIGILAPAMALAQTASTGLLSVYVQVSNPVGSSYSPSNFQVFVSGGNPSLNNFSGSVSGTLVTVTPGPYAVTVANQNGFTPSYSVGCNSTMFAGGTQLCVITMTGGTYNPVITSFPITALPAPLSCRAETPTVSLGQTARFSVVGGLGGTYNWSTASQNFPNIGPVLTTTFPSSGTQTVTVTNAGQTAVCVVTVLTTYAPVQTSGYNYNGYQGYTNYTSTYTAAPYFPNTGFAPGNGAQMAFATVLLMGAAIMSYPYARKAFAIAVR
ncbi:hypothetical protein EXS62_00390 [Candidatus Kaiserbacteria bacterium]|nr:hypothetical protein [Candidatus Kaiserbacteria bacterium]